MTDAEFAIHPTWETFSPAKNEPLLRELCDAFGPSGCEEEVARIILEKVRPLSDGILRDSMGNLLCYCRFGHGEDRQKIMICAHMDEVGMMITEICDDGTLRFDTLGGIHESVLEGRKITLGDENRRISGVIASKAIHHKKKDERNQITPVEQLYIDLGVNSRQEAEEWVSVGSFATFDSEFFRFGKDGKQVKAKALDDRMGCAAMISVMEALHQNPPRGNLDVYFCFTVREEIGLSGAKTAAQRIAPNLAIVLECTAVADLPNVAENSQVAKQGCGGALSVMDRSTVYDRAFLNFALQCAKQSEIPVQLKRYVSGGNDAGSIHKTGVGVRTLALSVPTRYLHSPACVAHLDDFDSVSRLVEAMLRHPDLERI